MQSFPNHTDPETAASAVRNLADYQIGNRKLRVQLSQTQSSGGGRSAVDPPPSMAPRATATPPTAPSAARTQVLPPATDMLPPNLPTGTVPPTGVSVHEAIAKTLSSFQPPVLLDILSQLKTVVHQEPEQARQLLESNPQLSYAVLQALLMMKLVDPAVLSAVIQATSQQGVPAMNNGTPAPPSASATPQPAQPPNNDSQKVRCMNLYLLILLGRIDRSSNGTHG